MRIATNNKLAHLQIELETLSNQTMMLQNQLAPLEEQILRLQNYININIGDRQSLQELRGLQRRYNSLRTQITKNCRRMNSLNVRINNEIQRISYSNMRRCSRY